MQHLRTEGGADKLPISLFRYRLEHLCNGRTVLGIEIGIDFVEEVERCWVASLDSEHEGQCTETWTTIRKLAVRAQKR